ncbi:hypothetical protein SAMN03159362_3610 [Pseudomonas sp. NFIX51]|uniref:DUF4145 domain-containing protein n=1 Tax=unclassified Pseudomonas TaxID=196821 RepID=UPI0008BE3E3E|nr:MULTISPECIES: DUF4145 domain-containing protein [unclassified Pseudomonas]SEL19570.1 hypothetical protein SAMN03159414_1952 [Pseudomonas sp. NFACC41-3]SMH53448.1 hypothetical protein SAMN03159362_3610 [Pseudomonas sp. NFIX51]
MDNLEFTAKVIEALAWPVGVVTLVAMLRKEVLELIPKLTKLEAGPLKAEFSIEAKKVLVEAQEIQLAPLEGAEVSVPSDIPRDDGMDQDPLSIAMWRTAAFSPSTAIVDAWKDIEEALLAIIADRGVFIPERSTRNVAVWINAISQEGILPLDTVSVIHELRELRNKAAHAGFDPTPEAAQDYLLAAQRLVRVLRSYLSKGA